jgi:Family of unknown function (DUF6459)
MQENLPSEFPLPARQRSHGRSAAVPDRVAVRRVAIPDAAPPYDDEPRLRDLERQATADAGGPEQAGPTAGRPEPGGSRPGGLAAPGPPGAQAWPSQFAQVLAETLAGSRPATQLRPWTTEQTRQRIRQLGPVLATGQQPRVRRIMTSAPNPDVLEMTAVVVGFGSRIRVLAVRLERGEEACQHWRCTAIESA